MKKYLVALDGVLYISTAVVNGEAALAEAKDRYPLISNSAYLFTELPLKGINDL